MPPTRPLSAASWAKCSPSSTAAAFRKRSATAGRPPVGLFHAAGTGTDTRLPPQLWLYAVCLAAVAAAAGWRLYRAGPGHIAARLSAGLLVVAVPLPATAFLATGPLQPGWSHRAAALSVTVLGGIR
ncbi:hypothetical protein ACFV1W_27995 [Kitasatospora sp. NPDC059648]|uniref:hypothetical protein n=1 Tax=Kitasatospora sp. NPDC059648 TaxID=3346894 RepID=UPI0036A6B6D5